MTLVQLISALFFAGFPPSATPEAGVFEAQALGATSFLLRSEDATGLPDGFDLQHARLTLAGGLTDWLSVYAALATDDATFGPTEAFVDAAPTTWLDIRAGRWLLDLGPVTGQRIEERRFTDVPLATAKFYAPNGLYDTGLGVAFVAPIERFPITLSATITSGTEGLSFAPKPGDYTGTEVVKRLLYAVRLEIDPGKLFGQTLTAGFTFAGGANDTGPGNRTDMIGADAATVIHVGALRLFADLEFLMRRYSNVDLAKNVGKLDVEGGLTVDAGFAWDRWEGAVRFDLLGVPSPPDVDSGWRFTAAAGFRPIGVTRFLAQYSARHDDPKACLVHEVTLQAIFGFAASFGGGPGVAVTPRAIYEPKVEALKTPTPEVRAPEPVEVMPGSSNPSDWLSAARDDHATARALLAADRHLGAAFSSQQAAMKALRAAALHSRAAIPLGDRSATGAAQALAASGAAPPEAILSAARELDRHHATARFPPDLGGAPGRYYDREAATRAVGLAGDVLKWAEAGLGAAPVP